MHDGVWGSRPPYERVALVLSGGGSLGAYQVGVLEALAHGLCRANGRRAFDPPLIVGTSVGAFNAAFLSAQGDVPFPVAVGRLKDLWLRRIADRGHGNGVFRYRLDPEAFFRLLLWDPSSARDRLEADIRFVRRHILRQLRSVPRGRRSLVETVFRLLDLSTYVSLEPFWQTIGQALDMGRLATSPRRLLTTALTWPGLVLRRFEGRDPIWRREGACLLYAAIAVPGIFPPVIVDGECLFDASLSTNTPISPAIRAGAGCLHVVLPMVLPWQS
ncbi:MAG: patatin-like phospholipase family protein, partial [Holophagales bacterium]|nr:patatin-like phospholipase family protein [Holophagales bacterium]